MKDYESIYILAPTIDESESEKITQRMQDVITANGGEIVKVDKWGKRRLAYTVRKHKKGEYVLVQFKGQAVTVAELERNFKMVDSIIKYMTVRIEKDMLKLQQAAEAAPAEEAAEGAAPEAATGEATEQEAPEKEAGE